MEIHFHLSTTYILSFHQQWMLSRIFQMKSFKILSFFGIFENLHQQRCESLKFLRCVHAHLEQEMCALTNWRRGGLTKDHMFIKELTESVSIASSTYYLLLLKKIELCYPQKIRLKNSFKERNVILISNCEKFWLKSCSERKVLFGVLLKSAQSHWEYKHLRDRVCKLFLLQQVLHKIYHQCVNTSAVLKSFEKSILQDHFLERVQNIATKKPPISDITGHSLNLLNWFKYVSTMAVCLRIKLRVARVNMKYDRSEHNGCLDTSLLAGSHFETKMI